MKRPPLVKGGQGRSSREVRETALCLPLIWILGLVALVAAALFS